MTMVDVMEDGRKLLMTLNDKAHREMVKTILAKVVENWRKPEEERGRAESGTG